jgi:hypothetical protein
MSSSWRGRAGVAAGEAAVNYKTRTAHSEARVVRGTGYGVDHLDQPRAGLPSSAEIHLHARSTSYDRMYR